MKSTFDFPLFSDLKLGPLGVEGGGEGCMISKRNEIQTAAGMNWREQDAFRDSVIRFVNRSGGAGSYGRLCDYTHRNSLKDRKLAYRALEVCTERLGYEIES